MITKKNMKQSGLLVLSTMALGTAIVPALGNTTAQAQGSTKQSTPAVSKEIFYKMNGLQQQASVELLDYAKKGIVAQLLTLPLKEQVLLQKELSEVENVVRDRELRENYQRLTNRKELLRDIDVRLFQERVSKIPVNAPAYRSVQGMASNLKEMKIQLDLDGLLKQARYGSLTPVELKKLDELVKLLPSKTVVSTTDKKAVVAKMKEQQQQKTIHNALVVADKLPDKSLISKIKVDVNKMTNGNVKNSFLSKVSTLEKKQRVIPAKELQQQATRMVEQSGFGEHDVPVYLQDMVKQELKELKSTSVNSYLKISERFYGGEIETYYRYLKEEAPITKDELITMESKVASYQRTTGVDSNNIYQRFLPRMQEDESRTALLRVKYYGTALPKGEKEETLRGASRFDATYQRIALKEVDAVRADEAHPFISYYQKTAKNTPSKQTDYNAALQKINEVQDTKMKEQLLQYLNR